MLRDGGLLQSSNDSEHDANNLQHRLDTLPTDNKLNAMVAPQKADQFKRSNNMSMDKRASTVRSIK
jgi:hypothetical protein